MPAPAKPLLWSVVACVMLAGLSAAVLPTVPSYDPWAWVVWGRELVDPHLAFATNGGPSWKPLPVLFTTVYGLFGGTAPTLWVITARAGGLLALLGVGRLAARVARSGFRSDPEQARLAAGIAAVVAVLGLALSRDFFYYVFRGTSEPILIAAAVWSAERLLARRHGQAFALALALSLLRPEAWPFIACYAIWLWFRLPALRPFVAIGLLAIPLAWLVPPWAGSGQPLLAASHARAYNGHLGRDPVITALRRALDLQIAPVLVASAVTVAWSLASGRDRVTLALSGGALAWIAIVVAMAIDGYPGLERFFYPAAAVFCVLAGVGLSKLAMLAAAAGAAPPAAKARAVLVAVLLAAVCIPPVSSRITAARAEKTAAERAVTVLDQLSAAARAAGGHAGVYPCSSSFAAVNHGVQTALAWKLRVTLARVGTALRKPGVDFIGPRGAVAGIPPPVAPGLTHVQRIASVGVWRVVRVTYPGRADRCVGH